jgi:putative transposase
MDKYQKKFRIPSTRLTHWDYGSPGLYFVTICTKNRQLFFGDIVETQDFASLDNHPSAENSNAPGINTNTETQNLASLRTKIGEMAHKYWEDIPTHFPFVELDEYVVMPNHVHGILFINKPDYRGWQPNKIGPQSRNLASIIRGYKAAVKTFATTNQVEFDWQPRFYDHIIKSEKELNKIREYIIFNPAKWNLDRNNLENLMM